MRKRSISDLIGKHYGHWTVISEATNPKRHGLQLLCRCDCGTEKIIDASELTHGKTKMCVNCAKKRTKRDPEAVRAYMADHTRSEGARHFGITYATIDKYMVRYGIKAGKVEEKRPRKVLTVAKPKPKPTPEQVARARREFNVDILPRTIPGVNERSPHAERQWKYGGSDYLDRMRAYERMVAK